MFRKEKPDYNHQQYGFYTIDTMGPKKLLSSPSRFND